MRIAIVGLGVAGSYLLNRLSNEHDVTGYEMQKEGEFQAICAWGTSKNELSKIMKPIDIDFEKYIFFNGKKMSVDLGNGKSTSIPLKGLVTYNKHQLEVDLTKGKKVHFGVRATPSMLKDENYDMIVDCTSLHRAFLPKVKEDMWIPCVEYKFDYGKGNAPFDDFFIKPFEGLCVTGDTLVLSNPGAKQIQKMSEGEAVLTNEGFAKVRKVFKRHYEGEIIQITPYIFNFPVRLTPGHLVWVLRSDSGEPGWKHAEQIRESHSKVLGDYVCVPLPTHEEMRSLKLSDYIDGVVKNDLIFPKRKNQFGADFAYGHPLPNEIFVTDEVAEFFGHYISEGSTSPRGIILTNADSEVRTRMKVLGERIFQIEGQEHRPHQIRFTSTVLKRLFVSLFGKGGLNKEIPHSFLGLPRTAKIAFIRGLFLRDGSKERKDIHEHLSYTTRSRQLAFGLWQLLLSLGVVSSIEYSKVNSSMRLRIEGAQTTQFREIFGSLRTSRSDRISEKYFIKEGKLYFAVRKVSKSSFSGNVYDLGTNGSFTTSFLVHNSGYFWYFPLEDGTAYVGAGDYHKRHNEVLDKFNLENPGRVIKKIGRPIRITPPKYCEPFHVGNVVGCGESIGTVFPLLGEGIIPSLQCAQLLSDNLEDLEAYRKAVLKKFEYFNYVYDIIKLKFSGNFSMVRHFPLLLKTYREMKKMEDRFGMSVRMNDFREIISAY